MIVELTKASIGSGKIVPTVYQDTLNPIGTEAEMLQFAEQIMSTVPAYDIGGLFTREYFLAHVRSCLRPVTEDDESLTYPAFGDLTVLRSSLNTARTRDFSQ